MENRYVLEIVMKNNTDILDLQIDSDFEWKYEIEIDKNVFSFHVFQWENDRYFDYINYFLDILTPRYEQLEKNWIQREYISIWRYYKYFEQCNMEFSPKEMKRLWDNGITLCVSCMDLAGDEYMHFWEYKVLKKDWF